MVKLRDALKAQAAQPAWAQFPADVDGGLLHFNYGDT